MAVLKPGLKTSEGLLMLLAIVLSTILNSGIIPQFLEDGLADAITKIGASIVMVLGAWGYGAQRTKLKETEVKKNGTSPPVILLLCSLLFLGGCTQGCELQTPDFLLTENSRLATARETFNTTVRSLTVFREAGYFTKTEGAVITVFIETAQSSLDEWQASLELKQPTDSASERFRKSIQKLRAALIAAQRKEKPLGTSTSLGLDGSGSQCDRPPGEVACHRSAYQGRCGCDDGRAKRSQERERRCGIGLGCRRRA